MKRKFFLLCSTFIVFILSQARAELQTKFTNYTLGYAQLGTDRVVDLAIDSGGNKWAAVRDLTGDREIGGVTALASFIGFLPVTSTDHTTDSLIPSAIAAGPDSTVWCGWGSDIVKITISERHKYQWTVYDTVRTSLPGNAVINDIAAGPEGVMFFATSAGLLEFRENSSTRIALGPDQRTTCVDADSRGVVYFGMYSNGVYKIEGHSVLPVVPGSELDGPVTALTVDAHGRVWFATYAAGSSGGPGSIGIYLDANGTLSHDSFGEGTDNWFEVSDLDTDSLGNLWVVTRGGGVKRFDGTVWTSYTVVEGLPDNMVNAVVVERPDKVWFGTDSGVSLLRFVEKLDPLALADKDILSSNPLIDSTGNVFFGGTTGVFFAKKIAYGSPENIWTFKTGTAIVSSPAVDYQGTFYFGSGDHFVYAVRPDGSLKWKFETGDGVTASPALGEDGTIYVGSKDKSLYALDPDGGLKWRFETGGPVWSSPALGTDGTVYFGSHDKIFYALKPNGELLWSYATGGEIFSSPAVGLEGTVYFGSDDYSVYALNPDGTLKWSFRTGGEVISSPALDFDGTLYVGSSDYWLYALGPDGGLVWRAAVGAPVWSSPAITTAGEVVVGTCNALRTVDYSGLEDLIYNEFVVSRADLPRGGSASNFGTSSTPTVSVRGPVLQVSDGGFSYSASSRRVAGFENTNWPKFRHDYRNTGNVATSLEIPIRDVVERPVVRPTDCDINGDGRVSITDVIAMLLKGRDNPADPLLDWNGDGRFTFADALELIKDYWKGACPGAGAVLAANPGVPASPEIVALTPEEIRYIEEQLFRMDLTTEQRAALELALYGAAGPSSLPAAFSLAQNTPNPFNPATTIAFDVPEGFTEQVSLKVYDLRGKLVRTLIDGSAAPGIHSVFWQGEDDSGRKLGSGVYFYRLRAGEFMQTRKMILLK